jgi:arsenical pump membrane protein
MGFTSAVALIIFLLTVLLLVKRPQRVGIGVVAGSGAAASLLLGTVTVIDAVEVFTNIWDAALAFLGIVIVSRTLDAMGFFRWAALKVVKLARGNGVKLYFYIAVLTAGVSILFANDSAVLILTPLVLEVITQLRIERGGRLAYLFAAGLIADTAAMPLITSNPVNIVSADFFGYSFIDHLVFMGPVALVTIALSLLVVYLFFRTEIPRTYSTALAETLVGRDLPISPSRLKLSIGTLVAIDLGYVLASLQGLPVSLVICAGALFLLAVYAGTARVGRAVASEEAKSVLGILREVNWDILLFMVGIFMVVQGLRHTGVVDFFAYLFLTTSSLPSFFSTLVPSLVVTFSASLMNNWPMTMLGLLSIDQAIATTPIAAQHFTTLVFANIIGNNLGPHFFPLGSLAILMWLDTMKRKGVTIRLVEYLKVGSVLSMVEVTAASIVLWLEVNGLQMRLAVLP